MSAPASPYAIPGWMITLITDGVHASVDQSLNSEVTKATRSIMLSAHRLGIDWTYLRGLLCDDRERKLAHQIAVGFGGRKVTKGQRNAYLAQHWEDTRRIVADSPKWDQNFIPNFLAFVEDNWHLTDHLPKPQRLVLGFALNEAKRLTITRPALPVRAVCVNTGLKRDKAHNTLKRLVEDGEWLRLHRRGIAGPRGVGKAASIYHFAPVLLSEYQAIPDIGRGAKAPMSDHPPMSDPPMSELNEDSLSMSITVTGNSQAALKQALALVAAASQEDLAAAVRESDAPRLRLLAGGAS